jgi:hypothetical protein
MLLSLVFWFVDVLHRIIVKFLSSFTGNQMFVMLPLASDTGRSDDDGENIPNIYNTMQIHHLSKAMLSEYRLMFAFKLVDLLACFVIFESLSAQGPGVLTIKMGREPLLSLPEKTFLGGSGVSKLNHETGVRHVELSCSSPFFFKKKSKRRCQPRITAARACRCKVMRPLE